MLLQIGRLQSERVFLWDVYVVEPGNDSRDAYAGTLKQHVKAGVEQRRVSAKLVDDERLYQLLLFGFEQHHSPNKGSEYAAAVDVAHDDDRGVCVARHPHVHYLVFFQINLSGTARAFYDHDVVLRPQRVKRLCYERP